jgi:hypothetical protein
MYRGISVSSKCVMLSIPKALEEKNIYIPLREFISDVVMSRGNRRFLLTNLQAQIRGVTTTMVEWVTFDPIIGFLGLGYLRKR